MAADKVDSLKEEGNREVSLGNFAEAVVHYTQAIEADKKAYQIYSNRSFAFLKLQNYTSAYQDALSTISLNPEWSKGYFRKAEVESATNNFEDAFESYTRAFALQSNCSDLFQYIVKCQQKITEEKKRTIQIKWIGAGIGFILGTVLVLSDLLLANNPVMNHPVIQALAILFMAAVAYFIAQIYLRYKKSGYKDLIRQREELEVQEDDLPSTDTSKPLRRKFSKAATRQRYKKGKS